MILEDESKSYASDEVIPEENIESYFVWIPKYRYQLWDLGNYDSLTTIDTNKVHEIPVIFGDYNTTDLVSGECSTPMESGESGNCEVGDYMTHPAFLSIPSSGFWVGKFSTVYRGGTSKEGTMINVYDVSKIQIKPNQYIWRGLKLANAHLNSYNYKRELDSHAIKNTEWGAIAYLSHSKYGINGNIRINNNAENITGYQANNEPTCGYTGTNEECNRYCNDDTCNTAYPNSVLASTTGNITGMFDTNGVGTYVMGVMLDQNNRPVSGVNVDRNSGFNGTFTIPTNNVTNKTDGIDYPAEKYYDTYLYGTENYVFNRRILGDATGELGPFGSQSFGVFNTPITSWYGDLISQYFTTTCSFAVRGYEYSGGTYSGIFVIQCGRGEEGGKSYRIVLTPTKQD